MKKSTKSTSSIDTSDYYSANSKEPSPNPFVLTPEVSQPVIETPPLPPVIETPPLENIPNENDNSQKYDDLIKDIDGKDPSTNSFLTKKEKIEYNKYKDDYAKGVDESAGNVENIMQQFLYPDINDPNFNIKISKRNEFYSTKYDGKIYDIKKQAAILCNAEFELSPHQLFVKNFFSFQTPYNSLLLYHGLGSGKTCSAIGIAEEMRTYMKQVGIKQKIIIVASPNVQSNFRVQLFDERKLTKIQNPNNKSEDDIWNIQSCIGNALIKEINPTNLKGLARDKVITLINTIINNNYLFIGYSKLANHIMSKITIKEDRNLTEPERKKTELRNIRHFFNNRLFIIDEVHNIRLMDDNKNTKVASLIMKLARNTDNMRLLFLSATPMFNSYKEIIWITNLMNLNDKRATITNADVFNNDGTFKPKDLNNPGSEDGRSLLQRKLTGYVSYVRGENPYSFPYRIYPSMFSPDRTFAQNAYPKMQMNNTPIEEPISHLQLYLNNIGDYQRNGYNFIIEHLHNKSFNNYNKKGTEQIMPSFENMESFGYVILQNPIEALNIVYPNTELDKIISLRQSVNPVQSVNPGLLPTNEEEADIIKNIIGKPGLKNIMKYEETNNPTMRYNFEYEKDIKKRYGSIFNREHLHKYSSKISNICDIIRKSTGIVLIYSQYIDGGIVPMALALEEMGFGRHSSVVKFPKMLFKKAPVEPIDAVSMTPRSQYNANVVDNTDTKPFSQAKYVMITGEKGFSPNNPGDIKYATNSNNSDGSKVKVILISKSGSEGLDFKNIRQVHILDSWFNMNRIEQIIGRGVRNLSHCGLPFEERNVEIYLHATLLDQNIIGDREPGENKVNQSLENGPEVKDIKNNSSIEAADLYLYRYSEKKAMQIGIITRLIKEISVDCILNIGQTNFTIDKMLEVAKNQEIEIHLSSFPKDQLIPFKIGDRPYTEICDYMGDCSYKCISGDKQYDASSITDKDINMNSYNDTFIQMNNDRIMSRIRHLFREHHFYKRTVLINSINIVKQYPIEQIFYALTSFIKNKNEYLIDKYGRIGNLINKGDIYAFQPNEINDENASILDRTIPVDYKRASIFLELPQTLKKQSSIDLDRPEMNMSDSSNEGLSEGLTEGLPGSTESSSDASSSSDSSSQLKPNVHKKTKQNYENILKFVNQNLELTKSVQNMKSGEKNWYKHASYIREHLEIVYLVSDQLIDKYVVSHILDMFMIDEKLCVISHLYSNKIKMKLTETEQIIKAYFEDKILSNKNDPAQKGFILVTKNIGKIYSPVDGIWTQIDDDDEVNFFGSMKTQNLVIPNNKINNIVGFINIFKDKEMVFKIKDIRQKRNNKGARCDSARKSDVIKMINTTIGIDRYNEKNLETQYNALSLCVLTEFIMRHYTAIGKNNKVYFFSPEETFLNNIVNFSV